MAFLSLLELKRILVEECDISLFLKKAQELFYKSNTHEEIFFEDLTLYIDSPSNTSRTIGIYRLRQNNPKALSLFSERIEKSRCTLILVETVDIVEIEKIIEINNLEKKPPFVIPFLKSQKIYNTLIKKLSDSLYPLKKLEEQNSKTFYSIGITGTNGKTTTAFWGMQIARFFNHKAAYVGTLGCWYDNQQVSLLETTSPTYPELRQFLQKLEDENKEIEYLFMEVSSQALEQGRLLDWQFDKIAFTNFSQDHLDYHLTMENYFKAKTLLFFNNFSQSHDCKNQKESEGFLVHPEEQNLQNLLTKNEIPFTTCQTFLPEEIPWENLKKGFNKKNFELAWGLYFSSYSSPQKLHKPVFFELFPPPGRWETILCDFATVIVDFAHSPDSLKNILKEIRSHFLTPIPLYLVFGCGGNRDKSKRPLMGKVAALYADIIIITEDNPRWENSQEIAEQIKEGILGHLNLNKVQVILNRAEAISAALNQAFECYQKFQNEENKEKKPIVLVAGKGHESYQEKQGIKKSYSDQSTIRQILTTI